ncbi:MAG: NfeD family protein [Clostridiaceae bacterium]|nr:NfeD family protein [Clostridiaceae bacterium]MDD6704381.1 NfeD family protein [Clostridiaceae bacterium]MDY5934130.1 NfeD family protein [Oscillospiraceae bacterium]
MLWVWIGLIVVTAAVEAATVQLVTVWFAVGGVAGLIAYAAGLEIWLQILIFAIVSAVALAVTRPLVKKFTNGRRMPTNADRFIGEKAVVTEKIENDLSKGAVKIGGLEWTARSVDSETAEVGEQVTVEAIEGAKLIVRK